jgi:hypothetical protein
MTATPDSAARFPELFQWVVVFFCMRSTIPNDACEANHQPWIDGLALVLVFLSLRDDFSAAAHAKSRRRQRHISDQGAA